MRALRMLDWMVVKLMSTVGLICGIPFALLLLWAAVERASRDEWLSAAWWLFCATGWALLFWSGLRELRKVLRE